MIIYKFIYQNISAGIQPFAEFFAKLAILGKSFSHLASNFLPTKLLLEFSIFLLSLVLRIAKYPYLLQQASYSFKLTQEGFIRISKHTLVSYLIVSTILFGTGIGFLIKPWFGGNDVEAAWFNDNWAFRKEVPITANAAADTNAFFSFTLDTATLITAGQLQSGCQDIRVTDASGNILAYHVGRTNACNNAATTIDALAPYAPNSSTPTLIAGTSTFYVYYGNPSVSSKDRGSNFSQSEAASYTVGTLGTAASAPTATALWKFNEGVDNTCIVATNDACNSGNGGKTLDVAQSGMTTPSATSGWQTEDQCISGKCLRFDGSDDIVTTSGFANAFFTGSWTQSFWIKTTQTGNKVITEKGSNNAFIQINDGQVRPGTTTTSGDYFDTTGTPLVNDGEWHYVVATYNGSTNLLVAYIDGVARGSATTGNDAASSATAYSIGARVGPSVLFAGTLDEVKVYNFTQTAAQVLADFNARSNPEGVSQQQGNNIQNMPQVLSEGLVGYWKLDETSSTAADSSGYGLTLTNNNTVAYASGKFGNAGSFTAASSMYLSTATTISGVKTVSFWTNNASTTDEYINLIASTTYITSSSGTVSATGFTSPTIYVNGVLNGTLTASVWNHVVITTTTAINATAFEVGRGNGSYNNGKIDDVRTYNRALSASDIAQLYNWAPGPVGYWKLDEGTGTTAFDASGLANDLTLTNSPTYSNTAKYGKAINFAGSNAQLTRADDADFDFSSSGASFSWGAWIKHNTASATEIIISKYNEKGYKLYMESDGDLTCGIDDDNSTFPEDSATSTAATYDDNQWHNILCVKDGTTGLYLYIDGALIASDTTLSSTGSFENSDPLYVGIDADGTSNDWIGNIDEPKIYAYNRSSAQVVEDMNAGHPAPGSPVGTPTGYWKLDEGYGTTANNSGSGGTGVAGTITGSPAWTQAGKFGKALDFDGTTNQYVSISGSGTSLQEATDNSFTFTAWAKPDSAPANTNNSNSFSSILSRSGFHTFLYFSPSRQFGFSMWNNAGTPATFGVATTNTYTLSTWHHIAGVVNTVDSTVKLYVDGIYIGSQTFTGSPRDYTTASYYIGKVGTSACTVDFTWCFDGQIDEAKVYNSALTAAQVKTDMNRGQEQVLGALSDKSSYQAQAANQEYCVPGDSTSCAAPVGRWDLEEGTGTAAQDSSGNANTGTITAGTGSYTKGKLGKGYLFDGANTSISAGSGTTLDNLPAAGMTLEAWIYPKTFGETAGFILAKNVGASQSAGWILAMGTGANTLQFVVDGSSDLVVTTSSTVTYNTWNHVAVSWDGVITTASSVHIYINGNEASYSGQGNGANRVDDASSTFYIGNASTSDRTFDGTIDAIRVFNYARTPAQIAWDYNKGGPIAWWKMDECQGTVINDSSGFNVPGTLTIGASGEDTAGTCTTASTAWGGASGTSSTNAGRRNYAPTLDGTDDYIPITITNFPNPTTQITVATWVNFVAQRDFDNIVSRDNWVTAAKNSWLMFTSAAGTTYFGISEGTTQYNAGISVPTGSWQHLVGTYDGTTVKLYVNGVLRASNTKSGLIFSSLTAIQLARSAAFGGSFVSGKLDDTRIYNYGLTATQVKTLYNEGVANYGPTSGAP